jgi:hypothetical protein
VFRKIEIVASPHVGLYIWWCKFHPKFCTIHETSFIKFITNHPWIFLMSTFMTTYQNWSSWFWRKHFNNFYHYSIMATIFCAIEWWKSLSVGMIMVHVTFDYHWIMMMISIHIKQWQSCLVTIRQWPSYYHNHFLYERFSHCFKYLFTCILKIKKNKVVWKKYYNKGNLCLMFKKTN